VPEPRPVLIGFDGSDGSDRALREAGRLLASRRAIVAVVYKQGLGFELMELPTQTLGIPVARIDIEAAIDVDRAMQERAQRLAEQGAALARDAGFADPEPVVAGDDLETSVAETLVRLGRKHEVDAIVVLRHDRRGGEWFVGATTRDLIRFAGGTVVVAKPPSAEGW
jgi:nucleotide-binding universal stress UspA family protein